MKMAKKVLAVVLAVLMACAVFAACSKNTDNGNETKGTLVMATNAAFPPYEYKDGDSFAGIDVEIAEKIAKVDEYFALYDAIMNGLAEADAEFVRLYYMGNRRTSAKNRVMDALEISPATFYRDLGRINALIADIADKHTMFR